LLYHNNGNDNHFIEFRLIGTRSNRAAIGAKVRVRATINGQSFWQMREVPGGDGFMGQNSLQIHVGLGNATNVDLVRIEWPSGSRAGVDQCRGPAIPHRDLSRAANRAWRPARQNGQMQLTLTGKQGSRYAIETSTSVGQLDHAQPHRSQSRTRAVR
jgi:hypothetical protein